MLKRTMMMLILLSAVCLTLTAAEKYAILIAGDYTAANVPADKKWNDGLGNNTEFWNDLYLQWEMLYQKGYKNENIKVLFAHGIDLWNVDGFQYIDPRYRAYYVTGTEHERIVNYSATTDGLDRAIAEITSTSDDFLYVWVMSHGGSPIQSSIGFIGTDLQPLFYEMTPSEFSGKIGAIPAYKKSIVINANYAQDFENQYWGNSLVHLQLSAYGTKSYRADDRTNNGDYIDRLENEYINDIPYYHGELSFHNYISNVGHKPLGETDYDGYNLAFVDLNGDDINNIVETKFWTQIKHSGYGTPFFKDYDIVSTPEGDFGMCSHSSLEYPTLIQNRHLKSASEYYANNFPEKKGLIGITENIYISNPGFSVSLDLESNSVTEIINDKSIFLGGGEYGCHMSLGKGAVLQGTNNNVLEMMPSGSGSIMYTLLASNGAIFKNMTLKGNGFGYVYIEDNTDFINSHIVTDSGGPALAFMNAPCAISLKDNSSMRGIIQVYNYANAEGCSIEITDDSILECEALLLDNVDLNVNDFGYINYCNDNFSTFNCGIHVTGMGTLKFMPDGNYSPGSDISAGLLGQVLIGENSILNMNPANFKIEAGSKISLQEGARLNTNYIMPALSSIYAGNNSSLCGNINFSENSSLRVGMENIHHIAAGSVVNFYSGSKIWLNQASELIIDEGAVLNLYGGMTIVYAGGSNITNYGELNIFGEIYETTNVMPDLPDKGEPWGGIISGVGSKTSINYCTFTGATTAISGTPASLSVTNCTFTDCTNGINIVGCNNYTLEDNTLTGIDEGFGIIITSSDGTFSRNTISHFNIGAYFVMSSPVVSKCEISYNKYFGVVSSGHDAIPQLINTEDNQPFGAVNCTIQKNAFESHESLFPSAQIGINPTGSIYMRYNDIISSPNFYGISIAQEAIRDPNQIITIDAILNYWGTEDVTDDYFFEHPQYIIKYDPTWSLADEYNSSFNSYITEESRILTNAISLETEDKLTPAIKLYEHIIKKYVDTPEYYVAMTRLPYLYEQAELDNNVLISMYDEALNSDATSHKKFFKGKKVATHIKGRRYDDAIAVAEEMKAEADFEEEVVLAEINIALATLLKEAEGKGNRSVDNSAYLQELLTKLYGTEKYETPSDISENALPSESKLHQNYPNPFNPVTQIKYDLAKTSDVKLSVYNISGQKVAELASGVMNAGNHAVEFDGSKLNSGVYYYTLETDGVSMTKKMVLTK